MTSRNCKDAESEKAADADRPNLEKVENVPHDNSRKKKRNVKKRKTTIAIQVLPFCSKECQLKWKDSKFKQTVQVWHDLGWYLLYILDHSSTQLFQKNTKKKIFLAPKNCVNLCQPVSGFVPFTASVGFTSMTCYSQTALWKYSLLKTLIWFINNN